MTKQDLVARVSEKSKLTHAQAVLLVESVFESLMEALARGERVELRNFGVFDVRHRRPRVGRNPLKPDTTYQVPAHSVVKFKPGKEMAQAVRKLAAPEVPPQQTPPQ